MSKKCKSADEIAASPEVRQQYEKLPRPYSNIPLETLLTEPSTFRHAIENLVAGGLRRDKMTQHMEHVVVVEGALKHIERRPYSPSQLAQYLSQEAGQKDVNMMDIVGRAEYFCSLPQELFDGLENADHPNDFINLLSKHGKDAALGLIANRALSEETFGLSDDYLNAILRSQKLGCNNKTASAFSEQCHNFVYGSKSLVWAIERLFEDQVARRDANDASKFVQESNTYLDSDRQLQQEFKHPERIHLLVQRLAQERFVFLRTSPYAKFDEEGKPVIRNGKAWMRVVSEQ